MNSKEKKIGFVGVGRMGANMARNLKDKGYTISCVKRCKQGCCLGTRL